MIVMDYKQKWINHLERERDYFSTPPDHFHNWARNSMPEMIAGVYLSNALCALYAGGGIQVAEKFFCATIELIDRAFEEDRFHAKYAEYGLPKNQGEALRVRAYARALTGNDLNLEDLIQASKYYIEWCSAAKGAEWDSQAQSNYLDSIRMLLIADDLEGARELLKTKRKFKWHTEEHELLKTIVCEAELNIPIENEELYQRVIAFFDRIRDPDFKPDVFFPKDLGRFEWGVLLHKYFVDSERINWQDVIDSVSR